MNTQIRTHYFRDEDDNRTVVETSLITSTGQYRARILDGDFDISLAIGHGHSRLAAIADLQAKLEAVQ